MDTKPVTALTPVMTDEYNRKAKEANKALSKRTEPGPGFVTIEHTTEEWQSLIMAMHRLGLDWC